jgi:hypothetical protein
MFEPPHLCPGREREFAANGIAQDCRIRRERHGKQAGQLVCVNHEHSACWVFDPHLAGYRDPASGMPIDLAAFRAAARSPANAI